MRWSHGKASTHTTSRQRSIPVAPFAFLPPNSGRSLNAGPGTGPALAEAVETAWMRHALHATQHLQKRLTGIKATADE